MGGGSKPGGDPSGRGNSGAVDKLAPLNDPGDLYPEDSVTKIYTLPIIFEIELLPASDEVMS